MDENKAKEPHFDDYKKLPTIDLCSASSGDTSRSKDSYLVLFPTFCVEIISETLSQSVLCLEQEMYAKSTGYSVFIHTNSDPFWVGNVDTSKNRLINMLIELFFNKEITKHVYRIENEEKETNFFGIEYQLSTNYKELPPYDICSMETMISGAECEEYIVLFPTFSIEVIAENLPKAMSYLETKFPGNMADQFVVFNTKRDPFWIGLDHTNKGVLTETLIQLFFNKNI
ncbi:hypothetical protein [Carnobacterium maltaromaticum]|uniref:hypothetical protein n=1 Tax=Carnobacterium maltaromaticum TaxID=2751 RepID=UPI0012F90423|nr:hypothetical protein [Carnobacterium maltaromaticum]